MVFPQPFTTTQPLIASFDFQDIETGIGYNTYYCLTTEDAAVQYSLQPNTLNYSAIIETTQSASGTTTLTFDSSALNISRTVKGTAFATIGAETDTGAFANTFTAQLFKWDGTTATPISSAVVRTIGLVTAQTVLSFEMPCTETFISFGEQLRLVITIVNASGAGTFMSVGHDPQNRDGTRITPTTDDTITSTRINIPFKIEA